VLLDLAVSMTAYLIVTIGLLAATAALDDAARIAVSIASFVLLLVGGPIAVETLSHGRSLGKLAFGLRVVRDDGGPIRFRHALVRGAIGVVEILMTFGIIACIASLVSARGRRLGDVFAGTLVVRERIPVGHTAFVPPPPPWLAGRFSGLDLSAVPDGLWLAIRQYLTRMRQLDPQVGGAMAERLASDLAARTGAPAPQGVPAAAYLAAVVQERQARDARRAFGGGSAPAVPGAPGGFVAGMPGASGGPVTGQPGAHFYPQAYPRSGTSSPASARDPYPSASPASEGPAASAQQAPPAGPGPGVVRRRPTAGIRGARAPRRVPPGPRLPRGARRTDPPCPGL
jgi:uncharacterized RDD family membrane protein YckC